MNKSKSTETNSGAAATATEPANFRNNPEVDAKIDSYIKENPKYWAYLQNMPRERLERTVVLNEVRELDRQQRIRGHLMGRINGNPKLKAAYETLVKEVPEDQRETVMAKIAQETSRAVARTKGQRETKGEAVGV